MDRKLLERILGAVCGDGCWPWHGTIDAKGYGVIRVGDQFVRAHRLVYEATIARIADGFTLDHLCRNRACVNPSHLEPVSHTENTMRGESPPAQNARKTHCSHGHLFDEGNTYVGDGRRQCRACNRLAQRRYADRQRAAA